MNLNDLKESFIQIIQNIIEEVKESEVFNQLQEKYYNLSPKGQKTVMALTAIILLFIIFYSPINQVSSSNIFLTEFEEKKSLIKDMYKAYRSSNTTAEIPKAITSTAAAALQ